MPIGSRRQSRKSKGRDGDSEMLIDSSQQSRKGKAEMPIGSSSSKKGSRQLRKRKGRDGDPEMPPIDSSQDKGKDGDPEMPIDSSRKDGDPEMPIDSSQDKGKDGDPEMPIDSSQGKGFDEMEQVTESSSDSEYSSEKEYCDICGGDSHWPPMCKYLIYIPNGRQPINREKYQLVCYCGCAVLDNGEFI